MLRPWVRRVRAVGAALAVATLAVTLVAGCTSEEHAGSTPASTAAAAVVQQPPGPRPNIVFVLTDDLTENLIPYMPHVQALAREGMSFTNYTVADSLCCPSRASILTGNFPHTTKIEINHGVHGGFQAFQDHGEDKHTFAIPVHHRGYRTAFMGKYLNNYQASYPAPQVLRDLTPPSATYVPPGWDEWDAVGFGYTQYNYNLNHDHHVIRHGHAPSDYLNTVLQNYGTQFIASSAARHKPFFLEVASFSPHTPATAAPQDAGSFPGLNAPRTPAFDRLPRHAPSWIASRRPLTDSGIAGINMWFRKRVQSVQSVDRMVGALQHQLQLSGQLDNTIFVFNSDNGYHLGEHRLKPGKLTAYDTDVRVPLIVTGPGIAPGSTNNQLVQNVDLAPTFEQLAGARVPAGVEGRSFVALLHGARPAWRTLALVEHRGPDVAPDDPDRQSYASGNPPSYAALRSPRFTYVRYVNGDREYYDRATDPDELDNLAGALSPARSRQLERWLRALHTCTGAQCWAAGRPARY